MCAYLLNVVLLHRFDCYEISRNFTWNIRVSYREQWPPAAYPPSIILRQSGVRRSESLCPYHIDRLDLGCHRSLANILFALTEQHIPSILSFFSVAIMTSSCVANAEQG